LWFRFGLGGNFAALRSESCDCYLPALDPSLTNVYSDVHAKLDAWYVDYQFEASLRKDRFLNLNWDLGFGLSGFYFPKGTRVIWEADGVNLRLPNPNINDSWMLNSGTYGDLREFNLGLTMRVGWIFELAPRREIHTGLRYQGFLMDALDVEQMPGRVAWDQVALYVGLAVPISE
jgi:hypothetical protein